HRGSLRNPAPCRGRESWHCNCGDGERYVTAPHDKSPTSPCKGEVDRERSEERRGGKGRRERRGRERWIGERANWQGMSSVLVLHAERVAEAEQAPSAAGPHAGGGRARTEVVSAIRPLAGGGRAGTAIAVMESGT